MIARIEHPRPLVPGDPDFIGPVELMGTCDWGYCDREAVTIRWSKDHGWLSVCAPCKRSTWDRSARGRRR